MERNKWAENFKTIDPIIVALCERESNLHLEMGR